MKANKILTMAMIMAFSGVAFSSCSSDDDEKVAEKVEDIIANNTEYYINGIVANAKDNSAVSGANVKIGDQTATTNSEGVFSVAVKNKNSFDVEVSKDGFLKASKKVTLPSDMTNRSSVNVNFSISETGTSVTLPENSDKDVVVVAGSDKITDNIVSLDGIAMVFPQASINNMGGTEVTMTPVVSTSENVEGMTSITNLYVEENSKATAEGIKIALSNPFGQETGFEKLTVYKEDGNSRAGSNSIGDAELDANNNYVVTLSNDKINGEYSFKVPYTTTSSANKDVEDGKKENFELSAIKDYTFSFKEKIGWEVVSMTEVPESAKSYINNAVAALYGPQGIKENTKEVKANIGGNMILFYTITNNYEISDMNFKLAGGKTATVKVKNYKGTKFTYMLNDADQHSGGTAGR